MLYNTVEDMLPIQTEREEESQVLLHGHGEYADGTGMVNEVQETIMENNVVMVTLAAV